MDKYEISAAVALVIALIVACWLPVIEAREFNRCTGSTASYITAVTTDLRIESCK